METNRLKQFCTLVEIGNLRKASELLHISHSGLSKSMRILENETGRRLFLPNGRGIVISDEGRMLYERCAPFFGELDRLLGKTTSKNSKGIRVGSFEVFTSFFIGRLIRDYLNDFELEIHELAPGRLEEALLLNRVDIGITYNPLPRAGIEYVQVSKIEMGAFTCQGAFLDQKTLDIPFVIPVKPLEGAPSGVKGQDDWPDEQFRRKTPYRVDLMTTGLEIVHQGLAAIFIPKFVARLHNEDVRPDLALRELTLPKGFTGVTRDLYIVKRESTPESRAIRQISKALRKLH